MTLYDGYSTWGRIYNLVSSVVVTPTVTTTYTATVSGQGGTHSDEVTVTVLPVPSVTVTGPINADYGSDITVSYDATNVPTSLTLTPKYYDLDEITVGDLAFTTGMTLMVNIRSTVSRGVTGDLLLYNFI